jgi:hypothetical protein
MRIQFQGTPNEDDVADAFILAVLARHKGAPVSALQIWKSLRTRGFVPTDGTPTSQANPDEGAAVAEISRRLQGWLKQALVGGDAVPESITKDRHFWVLGNHLARG